MAGIVVRRTSPVFFGISLHFLRGMRDLSILLDETTTVVAILTNRVIGRKGAVCKSPRIGFAKDFPIFITETPLDVCLRTVIPLEVPMSGSSSDFIYNRGLRDEVGIRSHRCAPLSGRHRTERGLNGAVGDQVLGDVGVMNLRWWGNGIVHRK